MPHSLRATVRIRDGTRWVRAQLAIPPTPRAIVLVAHSPATDTNAAFAAALTRGFGEAGLATLRVDLEGRSNRPPGCDSCAPKMFAEAGTSSIVTATEWLLTTSPLRSLPVGYCALGASAPGALSAAVQFPRTVRAVVATAGFAPSISGIESLLAPTLFVLGERELAHTDALRSLQAQLRVSSALELVPGSVEDVAAVRALLALACKWYVGCLRPCAPRNLHAAR